MRNGWRSIWSGVRYTRAPLPPFTSVYQTGATISRFAAMNVHLIDGTYELFRYFFATPSHVTDAGQETGAVRGVLGSLIGLLEDGATHVGVATDHVIESFRNDMWDGYKDGSDIDPAIFGQFQLLEDVLSAAGMVVWPMVEYEADDALGAAALHGIERPPGR